MKKLLYFFPLIMLVVYIILFFPLREYLVRLETPTGENYQEAVERAYGYGKHERTGTFFDSSYLPDMVAKHDVFQGITLLVTIISIILKKICNAEKMGISKEIAKINIIIYIILIIILFILTIVTTGINPTFFL